MKQGAEAPEAWASLGQLIAVKIQERGWGLKEIAAAALLSRASLSRIIRDKQVPSPASLARITSALGLDPALVLRIAATSPAPAEATPWSSRRGHEFGR